MVNLLEQLSGNNFEVEYQSITPYDNTLEISDARIREFLQIKYKYSVKDTLTKQIKNLVR